MIPKNPNKLFREVAEELDISEELVDKFITFYYKNIRKELSELNHIRIRLAGLGEMRIRQKTVKNLIKKYENIASKIDTYKFSGYFNKKRLESRLEALANAEMKIKEFNKTISDFKENIKDGTKKDLDK